jgi:hypothetical protein
MIDGILVLDATLLYVAGRKPEEECAPDPDGQVA